MEKQRAAVEQLRQNPRRLRAILGLETGMTVIAYAVYIGLVVWLLYTDWLRGLQMIAITAVPFGVVSVFRLLLDQKRPYEKWGVEPLMKRRRGGRAFPSRHVFSMTLIATVLWQYCVCGSILLFVLGIVLSWCRVHLGMHYVRDVTAGYALGIGLGLIGLYSLTALHP